MGKQKGNREMAKKSVEFRLVEDTQRAQYPLIKEYGLNYMGLHIMI